MGFVSLATTQRGEIFYSKGLGTFVVFEPDESGTEPFHDWYAPSQPDVVWCDEEVGELEPVVRNLHYDAAMTRCEEFVRALQEALAIWGPSEPLGFISKKIQAR